MAKNTLTSPLGDIAGLPSLPMAMVQPLVVDGVTVTGTAGDDTIEIDGVTQTDVRALAGNDAITVTGGSSTIFGAKGNDVVDVTGPVAYLEFVGGDGTDQLDLSDSGIAGVVVDLGVTTAQTAAAGFELLLKGVETFFGTPDADTLTGDDGNNKIAGHGGTDTIYGLGGDDRLFASEGGSELAPVVIEGGAGSDIINFRIGTAIIDGAGMGAATDDSRDRFSFADSGQGGTIDLRETGAQQVSLDTVITMSGIEDLVGSYSNDVFTGTSGKNWMAGLDGNDRMVGLGGKDKLFGDAGNDKLYGGGGHDTLSGGSGRDRLDGGGGNDTASGGSQVDIFKLKGGNDFGEGGGGNDRMFGGTGADELNGDVGNDKLYGQNGADVLDGGKGRDLIDGGNGSDIMTGGVGADTFVLKGASGDDVITDFTIGVDKLDLDSGLGLGDLTFSQNGSDALVEWAGNSVLLEDVDKDDLSGADFLF